MKKRNYVSLALCMAMALTAIPAGFFTNGLLVNAEETAPATDEQTVADAPVEINVKDFGAKPNDKKDDTLAINKAIESLDKKKGGTIVIPKGKYIINPAGDMKLGNNRGRGILIEEAKNVTLKMSGAVFNVKPTKYGSSGLGSYQVISVRQSDNITLIGGNIKGERAKHKGSGGESGYGVCLWDSTNVKVKNMTIANNWADGIYIGSQNENYYKGCDKITIEKCTIKGNRRNGIAITMGKNITINNCKITNSAKGSIAPNTCIHVEANDYKYIFTNIKIKKTTCTNDKYDAGGNKNFIFYTHNDRSYTANKITFTDCKLNGDIKNISCEGLTFNKCKIKGKVYYRASTTFKKTDCAKEHF